jgi:hypothetical protein
MDAIATCFFVQAECHILCDLIQSNVLIVVFDKIGLYRSPAAAAAGSSPLLAPVT